MAFVATQALGWVLFSVSLIGLSWLIMQVAAGVAYCIRCWAIGVGSIMFAAQLVSMPYRFASFVAQSSRIMCGITLCMCCQERHCGLLSAAQLMSLSPLHIGQLLALISLTCKGVLRS